MYTYINTTTMKPLVDYPRQHIKHAHLQSWLWAKINNWTYWRLETIKNIKGQRQLAIICYKNQSKYSIPIKVLPPAIKMDRSTVHKLIGSNKLAANENKLKLDLITTLLAFPEMVLPKIQ